MGVGDIPIGLTVKFELAMFISKIISQQAAMLCVLFAFMNGSAAQLEGESSLSKEMPSLATLHSLVGDVENSEEVFSLDTNVEHARGKKVCTRNLGKLVLAMARRKCERLPWLLFRQRRTCGSRLRKLFRNLQVDLRKIFPQSTNPFKPCCHCERDFKEFTRQLMEVEKIITGVWKAFLDKDELETAVRKIKAVIDCIKNKCFGRGSRTGSKSGSGSGFDLLQKADTSVRESDAELGDAITGKTEVQAPS